MHTYENAKLEIKNFQATQNIGGTIWKPYIPKEINIQICF